MTQTNSNITSSLRSIYRSSERKSTGSFQSRADKPLSALFQSFCKAPLTISSPDRSPQARKGKKATGQISSAKKSLSFEDVSSSVVNTDSDHNELSTLNTADDSPQEAGERFLSYLNVEDLFESSSTEAKVVIVNPGGRVAGP